MKRMALILIATLAVAGVASAQTGPWGYPGYWGNQGQPVKVDGTLVLTNGVIGVQSGGKTYYTPMLGRLVGFVNGLAEGASARLEGYAYPLGYEAGYSMLAVTKLTVNGKSYDLVAPGRYGQGYGPGYGMYAGPGCRWGRW